MCSSFLSPITLFIFGAILTASVEPTRLPNQLTTEPPVFELPFCLKKRRPPGPDFHPTIEIAQAIMLQAQKLYNTSEFADLFDEDFIYYDCDMRHNKQTYIAKCLESGPEYFNRKVQRVEYGTDCFFYAATMMYKGRLVESEAEIRVLGNNKFKFSYGQEYC